MLTIQNIRWPRVIHLLLVAFVASTTVIASLITWLGEITSDPEPLDKILIAHPVLGAICMQVMFLAWIAMLMIPMRGSP